MADYYLKRIKIPITIQLHASDLFSWVFEHITLPAPLNKGGGF
jgi:hypothetical protein